MNSTTGAETEQFSYHPTIKNKKKALLPMAENPSTNQSSSSPSSSSSCDCSNITQMNHDHIISILQLLPVESILSFSMTCKKLRSLASTDALWEYICRRDWGKGPVDALLASLWAERREMPWKKLYEQVSQLSSVSCFRLSGKDGIFPKPRASHSLNFVSDCLVLFGGGCEGGRHLDDTWVAYIGNGVRNGVREVVNWQQVSSGTPSGRFGQSSTVIGDALVLFGGINDNGIRQNDTWIGQVIRNGCCEIRVAWKLLDVGPVAPPPRGAHAGCGIGDTRMVIHGGIGLDGLRLNDMWMLDLSDDLKSARWRQIVTPRPSPPARSGHSLTWIGGTRMVLFGGRGMGYEVLNDVWLFDTGGDHPEWVEVVCDCANIVPGGLPLPRVGHSATLVLGGQLLIYGGEDSQRQRKDDFWLLDVNVLLLPTVKMRFKTMDLKKMWKRLKTEGRQPDCRSFHSACTDQSGRCLYVFGGMIDSPLHPGEAYGLGFDGELYLVELVLQL